MVDVDVKRPLTHRGASARPERRRTPERRVATPHSVIIGGLRGRRRRIGRRGDDRWGYVDWYEPRLFLMANGVLLLCCFDALFTLELLGRGAVEWNPFMAVLIDTDIHLFVTVKLALTAGGLMFLVVHANFYLFRFLKLEEVLRLFMWWHLVLVGYELELLAGSPLLGLSPFPY